MCGSAPDMPAPDPNIAKAQTEMADLAKRQQTYYEQTVYPDLQKRSETQDALLKNYVDTTTKTADQQSQLAQAYQDRMQKTFYPVEDSVVSEAMNYDSGVQGEQMARDSMADVRSGMAQSQQMLGRQQAAMGAMPGTGRYNGTQQAAAVAEGAALASAATKAREGAQQLGWAKKMDAASLGKGLPSQQASAVGTALQAGQAGVSAGQGVVQNGMALNQSQQGNAGAVGNLWKGSADIGQNAYNSQVGAYGSASASSNAGMAGWGNLIGSGIGAYMSSSKEVKTGKHSVSAKTAADKIGKLNVEEWTYKPGVEDSGTHVTPYAEDTQAQFGDGVAPGGKMIDYAALNKQADQAIAELTARLDRLDPPRRARA